MLIPIALTALTIGLVASTRSATGEAGKPTIRVGDVVHIMPSFAIPGLLPQQAGYIAVRVDYVDEATLRGPVIQAGTSRATLQQLPTMFGPFSFPKTDVVLVATPRA